MPRAPMDKRTPTVAAVTVAFSRPELLRDVIASLRGQTRKVDEIIVIDHSGEGPIGPWLAGEKDLTVVTQKNAGSAGGFGRGLEIAYQKGHDWVWIIDDDGVPNLDALEKLTSCPYFAREDTAYLVSRVTNPAGRTQMSSLPTESPDWYGTILQDQCVRVSRATWLGLLVSARALERVGLPIFEFFIWHEDQEFTERMTQSMAGYCVLSSIIVHHQSGNALDPFTPGGYFKLSHGLRNEFGWIKLRKGSFLRKMVRVFALGLRDLGKILRGQMPLKSITWVLSGMFLFWPKVRPVEKRAAADAVPRPS